MTLQYQILPQSPIPGMDAPRNRRMPCLVAPPRSLRAVPMSARHLPGPVISPLPTKAHARPSGLRPPKRPGQAAVVEEVAAAVDEQVEMEGGGRAMLGLYRLMIVTGPTPFACRGN
jgi:hypothetical protein